MILVTDAESNTNEEQEVFDDGSFFGDVSSIVGADSLVVRFLTFLNHLFYAQWNLSFFLCFLAYQHDC